MRRKILRGFCLSVILGSLVACTNHKTPSGFKAQYSTPQLTFETWVEAARRLDMQLLLSTYAASARPETEQEFNNSSPQQLKQMQDEAHDTQFTVEQVVFEGEKAFLRVKRKLKSREEIEVITMVREGQEWKLLP